jgi:hypothetical protein
MAKEKEKGRSPNEGTVIERCNCKHAGQDALHGEGMRVKNNSSNGPRCTVCAPGAGARKAKKGS